MATTATVTAGEREMVVDAAEVNKMRAGAAWDQTTGRRLVDTYVGRPTRDGNGVAAKVLREEENKVFKFYNAVWMWSSGVKARDFVRL